MAESKAEPNPADDAPTSVHLRPRRWLGLIFWLACVAFLAWLWPRSNKTSDAFLIFGRSATLHGALSHQGNLMFATTTIEMNPEKALTTEHWTAPAEGEGGGDFFFHGAYTNATVYKPWFWYGYAETNKGDLPLRDASWAVLVAPHWALLAVCSLALVWHVWRFVLRSRERRWLRRGCCLNCGYDLQGITSDRCPECGASTALVLGGKTKLAPA